MLPGNHPESFNLRFFFCFFFWLRRPGILATLATDVARRPVAIYVLRCVCDSASSSERKRTASETDGAVPEWFSHDGPGAVRSAEHVEPPPKVASTCTFQSCFELLLHTTASGG